MMKLFQWRYGLLLLPVMLWLSVNSAHADITCEASMNNSIVNISNTITPSNANDASIEQTLTYSCTNTSDVTQWASICIGVDGGSNGTSQINPRHMIGRNGSRLNFNMTLNGMSNATWGNRTVGGEEFIDFFSVAPGTTPTIKTTVIRVSLLPNNETAKADKYTATFADVNTALTYVAVDSSSDTKQCSLEPQGTSSFSFEVQATVINECKINTTSNIDLRSHPASTTQVTGSNNQAIDMTCTNGALYNIGLSPSNENTEGQGVMGDTGNNNYQLPYKLHSNPTGTVWGNNGNTYDALTNGVKGAGNGTAQLHTVYVTVPNSDVRPAHYSDTVTVHVNY